MRELLCLGGIEATLKFARELRSDLVLHVEKFILRFRERATPAKRLGVGVDKLDVNLNVSAAGLDFAGHDGARAQRLANLPRRLFAVLEFSRRFLSDNDEVLQRLQLAGERGDEAVTHVGCLVGGADHLEWQDDHPVRVQRHRLGQGLGLFGRVGLR